MNTATTPLHRFPLTATACIDEFRAVASSIFGELAVDSPGRGEPFYVEANLYPLRDTSLYYGRYTAPVHIASSHAEFFAQGVTVAGNGAYVTGGIEQTLSTKDLPAPVTYSSSLDLKLAAGHAQLALYIRPDALMQKLAALIDAPLTEKIVIGGTDGGISPEAAFLKRLIGALADQADASEHLLSPLVASEFEQTMMVAFLTGYQHNYSAHFQRAPQAVAPWQVRRVEQYIEAHWDQPITIEILAATVHASARSIFDSFKKSRGYSPMVFLRKVRLANARAMLSQPGPQTSVTSVAFACGFGNLGHFAKAYAEAFHQLPSETLNAARGASHPR